MTDITDSASSDSEARLAAATRPPGRPNPVPSFRYDVVVVGAGAAGLVASGFLGATEARVALIEGNALGGDCTHVGCVPSKAVLHVASVVASARRGLDSGLLTGEVAADGAAAMREMRRIRADIAQSDSVERFEALGVDVYFGRARFDGPDSLTVTPGDGPEVDLRFDRVILATGSVPVVPSIEGIDGVDVLTNETVFDLDEPPTSLVIVGAGPVGCELGQAFSRLGTEVTIVEEAERVLPRDEERASQVLAGVLRSEGLDLRLGARVERVSPAGEGISVVAGGETVTAERLLVAAGRGAPPDPGYARLGVAVDGDGFPVVDDRMRTTAPHVHAVGDVALSARFTHMAAESALNAVTDQLVPLYSPRIRQDEAPWCTYTEPAVGHIGLTPEVAALRGVELDTHEVELGHVDRAALGDDTTGFVRIHTRRGTTRIEGATVVCREAAEVISQLAIARAAGTSLVGLAGVTFPYPSLGQAFQNIGQEVLLARKGRLAPLLRGMWALRRRVSRASREASRRGAVRR